MTAHPQLGTEPAPPPGAEPAGSGLVERLRAIVGAEHVVDHPHQLKTYESDGLLQYHVRPRAVVLPATTQEVSQVVRACHEQEVPWVARGSGSGLSGGALPVEDGILVSLTRMNRILEIDLDNQRVVCQPGVTNIAISNAVGPEFFYPPDPSSQIVCSIGGNVAENSGGAHCFKYGFTTHYVCGLEIVLHDGTIVRLGGKALDQPGYDLIGAFVGSEGTLGVATEVTVRIIPSPEAVRTLVAFFPTPRAAGEVVSDVVTGGVVPAAIEMMDNLTIRASEAMAGAGWPTDVGAALVIELDGAESECDSQFERVRELCAKHDALDVHVAASEEERALIWRMRKAAFPAMGRLYPSYYVQDGVIPRTKLPEVLDRIDELAKEYGLPVGNVFHAGDGNLHPLVCYDAKKEGEAERAEELAGEIIVACVEAGGSITGEHGVGVDKKRYMPKMFTEADLEAFQKLRCAFDPTGRTNPGKVMPTPRLCGEVPGPYREHPLEREGLAERF